MCQQAPFGCRSPVAGRLFKQFWAVGDGTALGIIGGPDDTAYPGMADRPGAHGTGFKRDIKGQSRQPIVAHDLTGGTQSHDLGMGGGIVAGDGLIGPFGDHGSGGFVDDDAADWGLVCIRRGLRQIQRHAHEPRIMVNHRSDNDKKPPRRQGADEVRPPRKGPGTSGSASRFGAKSGSFGKPGFTKDGPKGPRRGPARDAKGGADTSQSAEPPKRSERIAKAMARAGIASRREVERLIGLGKVAVNGKILDTPATLVTRDDVITVDGKPIGSAQSTRVWRYHKPAGLVTSHNDPMGRPTVFDALPSGLPRVISVGRLDLNTEGLLLLTNDGELSRALELPSTELVRHYRARARGKTTQERLDTLKDGVTVDGVTYGPIEARLDKAKESAEGEKGPANLWISVSITEGKNREVRKVLEHLGLTVNRLIRLAYGPFQLGTLAVGSVEEVGPRVIREMLSDYIRPENLPTGNTVATPAPQPGRRTSVPIVRGKSGSAMSDPSRKPSKVRAAETAQEEAAKRPEKKAGWAKAKPKFEHTKTFKPRARPEVGEGDERPRKPYQGRSEPRDDQFIDDRRPAGRGPRTPDGKPGGGKPGGGKPYGSKPGGPRSGAERSGGPGRSFGDRPGGGKSFGGKPGGRPGGKPFGGKPGGGGRGGSRGDR